MIDLKPNTVLHLGMNDNAANPFVGGFGIPTQLIANPHFTSADNWIWGYD